MMQDLVRHEAACMCQICVSQQRSDPERSDGEKPARDACEVRDLAHHAPAALASVAPNWLDDIRREAFQRAELLELPNFRYGLTIRMDYSDLTMPEFGIGPRATVKAPAGVVVVPIAEAADNALVKKWLFTLIKEKHRFAELHKAWADGWFIYVPKGVVCTEPIVVGHRASGVYAQHVLIVAEENVVVVERRESLDGHTFASHGTEIIVGDGATVRFVSVQDYGQDVFHFDYKNASVGRNGHMEWVDCCLGSGFTHSTMRSMLAGEGGVGTVKGLFVGNGEQRFDVGAQVIHAAPHTTSDISGRGVLNGKAKNIYRGLVRIERNAPGSNGFQKEDVLMLSEDAEADAIPQLEIDNNDVKCSHAATTTHLDKEKMFYLMARGLDEKSAVKLMVDGFFAPFLDAVGAEVASVVKKKIERRAIC